MAKGSNRLSAREVAAAKTPGMLVDGKGLCVVVISATSKTWVYRFQWQKKPAKMGLGSTLTVKLADARAMADRARWLVTMQRNPVDHRHYVVTGEEAPAVEEPPCPTFAEYADAYVDGMTDRDIKTQRIWKRTVKVHAAALRSKRLDEITTDDVVGVIKPLIERLPESGTKAIGHLGKIFDAAKVAGKMPGPNPALWKRHLEHLIRKPKPLTARGHHLALPYAEMPVFMARLRKVGGVGAKALEFNILTAMRTEGVVAARKGEINLERKVWTVPAEVMKMDVDHRVALSEDACKLVRALPNYDDLDAGDYLFPSPFKPGRHIDEMSMTRVLTRMGVKARSTVHGFRSTFRDWVGEETDFREVLAEIALAHKTGTDVERAYKRGDMLEKRFPLMEDWADYCRPA